MLVYFILWSYRKWNPLWKGWNEKVSILCLKTQKASGSVYETVSYVLKTVVMLHSTCEMQSYLSPNGRVKVLYCSWHVYNECFSWIFVVWSTKLGMVICLEKECTIFNVYSVAQKCPQCMYIWGLCLICECCLSGHSTISSQRFSIPPSTWTTSLNYWQITT